MILTDLRHKIKSIIALIDKRDVYMAILIVLTAIVSYILGMLSSIDALDAPVTIRNASAIVTATRETTNIASAQKTAVDSPSVQGMYVGSKSGTKYHLPTCAGAQRIIESNKIWFATKADAEKAGYTPAINCPGI